MARVKELLIAARAKIEKPENWTQGWFQRNALGDALFDDADGTACRWCALGAIAAVSNTPADSVTVQYFLTRALDMELYGAGVAFYNDTHTHEEVLALFDKAISNAD